MVVPLFLPLYRSRNTNANADDKCFVQSSKWGGVWERHVGRGLYFPLSGGGANTVQLFRMCFGTLLPPPPCNSIIWSRLPLGVAIVVAPRPQPGPSRGPYRLATMKTTAIPTSIPQSWHQNYTKSLGWTSVCSKIQPFGTLDTTHTVT